MRPGRKAEIQTVAALVTLAVMFFIGWFHFHVLPRFESLLAVGITAAIIAIGLSVRFRAH